MRLSWPFHLHPDRQAIVSEPFPDEWRPWLQASVLHYNDLTDPERARLEGDLRVFMREKYWEASADFGGVVTDEMKVVTSALAILLTVGFAEHDYYPNVDSIIFYPPGAQVIDANNVAPAISIFGGTDIDMMSPAYKTGPVMLTWQNSAGRSATDTETTGLALRAFAHRLDFQNPTTMGVPVLDSDALYDRWATVMEREFEQLKIDNGHDRQGALPAYGAANPGAFFVAATEAFFEKSTKLKATHPELYDVLLGYYKIDWAQRMRGGTHR